ERDAYLAFAAANTARPGITLVGAADGMLHAFASGAYRFGDDPSTGSFESRGYFLKTNNVRDYGDGSETWAWVPTGQIGRVKDSLPQTRGFFPGSSALVDGALAVDDVSAVGTFHTVAVVGQGQGQPYLTAIDVSDPGS